MSDEDQPLLELDKNKGASQTEHSGGNELNSLEKGGNESNIAQLGKLTLTAGVACLHMASTMGLITVGRKTRFWDRGRNTREKKQLRGQQRLLFGSRDALKPSLHLGLCRPYTRLNKVLIRDLDFDYAAFVSLLGFSGTLLCALFGLRGDFAAAKNAWKTYTAAILTVGLSNSLSAFFGNAVYETSLSFAFIQVVKCFTPVIVLLVGLAAGVEVLNRRVAGSLFIISAGLVMCVNGELNAEMFGIFLVLLGSFTEALRLLLLHGLKLPVMDGIIVMYPPTIAVLVCVFVATEYKDMMASGKHRIILNHPGLFTLATLLGICVNALSVALVSLTSGLTIKLLTHVRNLLLVVVGIVAFHEVLTVQEYVGYSVALGGLGWYTMERNRPK